MTKISNLYTLTNYISANSSGNVVIAAPASGYALDVTGTGRFTGALSGTSIGLSSSITASALYVTGMTAGSGAIYHTGSRLTFANYNTSGTLHFEVNGGTGALTLNSDTSASFVAGASFGGALSGTSATFSGNLTAGASPSSSSSPILLIAGKNGTFANIGGLQFGGTSTSNNGNNNLISSGSYFNGTSNIATANTASIYQQTVGTHIFYSNAGLTTGSSFTATPALTIASTGAATFSGSVTALESIYSTNKSSGFSESSIFQNGNKLTFAGGNQGFQFNDNANTTPLVRIYNDGKVGIGTTAPTGYGKLSVAGGIRIFDDNNGKLEIGRYSSGASDSYIKLGANSNSLRVTNKTDTVDIFTIQNDEKVGIGVTNPTGQLSIKNQVSNGANPVSSYSATNGINGQNFFNGYYASNTDNLGAYPRYLDIVSVGSPDGTNGGSNIRFFTNPIANNSPAVERMRITSAGNMGLGNGSAYAPYLLTLNVTGGGGTIGGIDNSNGASLGFIQFNAGSLFLNARGNGDTNDMVFYTGANERIRIKPAGDIQFKNTLVSYTGSTGTPTVDTSVSFTTLANGGTVDFPSMSGMILVNNLGTGAVQLFICGGGNTSSLGYVVNSTGTMAHNPSVGGYRFTNNTGSIWSYSFQVFKTRGTA